MATKSFFPLNLMAPVRDFLSREMHRLEKRRQQVEAEDPFKDEFRVNDNASPDLEADEQFGHAKTTALQRHLDRQLIQIRKALSRIKIGKYGVCEQCGRMIDTDRLTVVPSATLCIECENKQEK